LKTSPLQLLRYFVPEIACTANKEFNVEKDVEVSMDQFQVLVELSRSEEEEEQNSWLLDMAVIQQIGPKQNFPYEFKLNIVGIFSCKKELPNGIDEERFVKVNGASILYGVAREIVRSTTANGPWSELIVPTVSFFEPPTETETGKATSATPSHSTP